MSKGKLIVMLGVRADSKEKGGIHSVVQALRAGGLFERWPIHYIGTVASGSQVWKLRVLVSAIVEFLRIVLGGRLELLHAQTSSRASFWRKSIFITIALLAKRPVVLHLHGSEFETFYRDECGSLAQAVVRSILNRVDRVVVLSLHWQHFIQSIAPAARVVRIYNPAPGLDSSATFGIERNAKTLLFLGRFGTRKGIFDLLQALALVKARVPDVRLRCGGDGDIAGVRARAQTLGIADCVEVLGWVSGEAKDRELARAAIYLLPSYAEGLPMGILEAMAAGAAVISTPIGGIPDAIEDGVNGFLVKPGDVPALAARIVELLENSARRAAFAAAARSKVQECFTRERVLAQIDAMYASLGAKPRPPVEMESIADARQRSFV